MSHHYEVTAHGTLLVHKIKDPSGKERELTMLPVDHEHVHLGSGNTSLLLRVYT